MCYLLKRIFPKQEFIRNGYFSFLRSLKGQPMQLDMFFPALGLDFEYQGAQHAEFNPFFHRTKKAFQYQKACDNRKREILRTRGITIIEVKHTDPLTQDNLTATIIAAGRKDVLSPNE